MERDCARNVSRSAFKLLRLVCDTAALRYGNAYLKFAGREATAIIVSVLRMPTLIHSDIWRDGGSLSATVLDGGQQRSFWLQTNSWIKPQDSGHVHLFVSEGGDPEAKQHRIDISSSEECKWIDYLVGVEDIGAEPESKRVFRDMIAVLQARRSDK